MTIGSLYVPADRAALIVRVRSLRPDSPRQWGKMDSAQMLAHCQVGLRLALGEMKLKRALIGYLFGGMARRKLLSPEPWGRNLPTAPEFKIKGSGDFAREREALVGLLERFGDGGPEVLTKEPHPFFGKLSSAEWDVLQWRHVDHHLRQFGA